LQQFSDDLPEWARRIDFDLDVKEDFELQWSLETVQPIYQTPNTLQHTLFTEARYGSTDPSETLNLGLGYRYLTSDEQMLLGTNVFYDYAYFHRHRRIGFGGEIIGQFYSVHANYYEGISSERNFTEASGVVLSERVLDGWDYEGLIQMPYLPWLKAGIKNYAWVNGKYADDLHGLQWSLKMNITKNITAEVGRSYDDISDNTFFKIGFSLAGPERNEFTAFDNGITSEFYPDRDLKKQTLAKVRRNHNVVIEEKRTGGLGVVIGRRN